MSSSTSRSGLPNAGGSPLRVMILLVLITDLGGNMTAVGASANVVVVGIAARNETPISFWEFTKKGSIVTLITILVAAPYLWLHYFA